LGVTLLRAQLNPQWCQAVVNTVFPKLLFKVSHGGVNFCTASRLVVIAPTLANRNKACMRYGANYEKNCECVNNPIHKEAV
jgi:hypothetical protein